MSYFTIRKERLRVLCPRSIKKESRKLVTYETLSSQQKLTVVLVSSRNNVSSTSYFNETERESRRNMFLITC